MNNNPENHTITKHKCKQYNISSGNCYPRVRDCPVDILSSMFPERGINASVCINGYMYFAWSSYIVLNKIIKDNFIFIAPDKDSIEIPTKDIIE